jgi:hypothetical protein
MNSFLGRVFFVVAFLVSSISTTHLWGAPWPADVVENSHRYQVPYKDGFLSSAWGICFESNDRYKFDFGFERVSVQTSHLRRPISIPHIYQIDNRYRPVPAPVVFFLSGAFGDAEGPSNLQMLNWYSKIGYHVIAIHDPWSKPYIKAGPYASLGDPEKEAESLYEIIKKTLVTLKVRGLVLGKPRIVGLSHGAFLGTVIATLDSESQKPIGFEDVTAWSAPYDLNETVDALDSALNETFSDYLNSSVGKVGRRYIELCKLDGLIRPPRDLQEEAKMMTTWFGFQDFLVEALYDYEKYVGLPDGKTLPGGVNDKKSPNEKTFKAAVRFRSTLTNYFPDALKVVESEKGKISYWISRAALNGFKDIRLFASEDDFLNKNSAWKSPVKYDLILIDSGGHFGYRRLDWFEEVFRMSFDPAHLNAGFAMTGSK